MLLLLVGSGNFGRDAIIERFLNGHENWRFVSIDDDEILLELSAGEEDEETGTVSVDAREFFVNTILQCTKQLQEQNLHIVAACDELPDHLISFLRKDLGDNLLLIHLGDIHMVEKGEEDTYDHFIDTKTCSVKDAEEQLSKLITVP
ncbi:hypothetical protein COW95_03780 [Candidatus Peregrinibacteria bacterium CG22_combo_CG10-13_8_21_14_all_49_11]|nr:MAG: hypothetical protein COW95_03780 [Candidatus Peregrinibacteria bacterium CG22_combo_CG10-13_8_21_14_all_49_11]